MSGWWVVVVVVVVATNFSVSSRQGFKLLGLSPYAILAFPCHSLPDPCLSFTKIILCEVD